MFFISAHLMKRKKKKLQATIMTTLSTQILSTEKFDVHHNKIPYPVPVDLHNKTQYPVVE